MGLDRGEDRAEIRRIKECIQTLRRKYGSFRRLYRYVEYGEPLGFQVDYLEAFNDLCNWKELQYELEELRRDMNKREK